MIQTKKMFNRILSFLFEKISDIFFQLFLLLCLNDQQYFKVYSNLYDDKIFNPQYI